MADFDDDWEVLQPEGEDETGEGGVAVAAEGDGLMMLRLDYFSIDSNVEFSRGGDESDPSSEGGGSVESDNPRWVDPAAFCRTNCGELWPDSASDRSKMSDCGEKIGLGFVQSSDIHVFELENQRSYLGKLGYESGGESSVGMELEGVHEVEKLIVVSGDCVERMDMNMTMTENVNEEVSNVTELGVQGEEMCVEAAMDGKTEEEVDLPVEVGKKALIWWKLPMELVKFCVFRVNPLWSISVAAAMVGVFIMRRRLHMMKRKTKSLQMKVTVDHKKVDQFLSRAARLNEAFSVVKRVPIIRPSLPAPGVTPWPVITMR
ncbi:unnamed protein product [Rhodiola kirilowii]